ncbi:MAG: hypothetical protein QME78_17895 [Thermodesulfobacteriota bacterium]|nr:hypothetical protein [Thermodesulfobacteriota bacterium]
MLPKDSPSRPFLDLDDLPRLGVQGASLGSMRRWSFHRWGGKRRPASFCGDPAETFGKALSRPMLPALIALNPEPRIGFL